MSDRRRILLLFGGRSAEHEISCISARSVMAALDPARFEVVPVGIAKDGSWHLMPGPPSLPAETGRMPEVVPASGAGSRVALGAQGAARELVSADGTRASIDVALPVLHGPMGEDGAVQGLLELADVPYVGAGVLGSAIGMDKAIQKVLFAAAGLPVGPWETVREPEWQEDPEGVMARVAALGYPVFTKPATLGSSIGISKVGGADDLGGALKESFGFARKAVVERAIEGAREIECAVLGNDDPVASVCGEVVPTGHEFYDYASKYLDEHGARLIVPASLDPDVHTTLQRMAVAAFQAVESWGMARVDFFLRDEEIFLNEINTIPGFTSISMYPKLWAASGLAYGELIERLIELAIERHDAERGKRASPAELDGGVEVAPGVVAPTDARPDR